MSKSGSDIQLVPYFIDEDSKTLTLQPPSNAKALEWLAVLGAAGVRYELTKEQGRWSIAVDEDSQSTAMQQLREYEVECGHWPPKLDLDLADSNGVNITSFYAGICLGCFFLITGPYNSHVVWFQQGQGDTQQMISGQYWRAVTALTLHSDFSHVAGNVLSCTFLCGAVCQYIGNGFGWLLILASGTLANLSSIVIHQPTYRYVGASTAIFAAIGILGTLQSIRLYNRNQIFNHHQFLPLLSVVAILSVLGAGPKADIFGHIMGAIFGILFGFPASVLKKHRHRVVPQFYCLLFAGGIVLISWACALKKVSLPRPF